MDKKKETVTDKKSFVFYHDQFESIKNLPKEIFADLIMAVMDYSSTGTEPDFDPVMCALFSTFKNTIDRDREKYNKICNRNRDNGLKGGRPKNPVKPKKPSGLIGNPSEPKKADSDSDSDSVRDSERDIKNTPSFDVEDAFNQFWAIFPKKVGKLDAKKKFAKAMKEATLSELLESLNKQKLSFEWTKQNGRYIPNPSTWLNQGRWMDEIEVATPKAKKMSEMTYQEQQEHLDKIQANIMGARK